MARSIAVIYNQIVTTYQNEAALLGVVVTPENWGLLNRRRLWANAQAFAIWILETFFDEHKANVDDTILRMKPGTPEWYVEMAKNFQYGCSLIPETDKYDNTGLTEEQVKQSKIIKYAAMVEEPFIRLKLAKLNGSDLVPLTENERESAAAYIMRIKYAGVKLKDERITSTVADKLKLTLRIVYDPLVLDGQGSRRDGTVIEPVKDAVKSYLQNLDFNGEFDIQQLTDSIQKVDGVKTLAIDLVATKYGALPFTAVNIKRVADSGYFVIEDNDFSAQYIPQ